MAEIKHSWFDCDGTLYKETPELQARRMNAILNELQRRTHRSVSDLSGEYKQKLRKRGTNTLALKDYGLTPDEARTVYNSVDVLNFIEPDPRLIRTMKQLLDSGVDISVFTNNKRSRLLDIIEKIGQMTALPRYKRKTLTRSAICCCSSKATTDSPHYADGT